MDPGAVVLAPLEESLLLPATTGMKVVGLRHGSPFVADYAQRRDDTLAFFDPRSSGALRANLISRYNVRYVMAPRGLALGASLEAVGLVKIVEDDSYAVWRVR